MTTIDNKRQKYIIESVVFFKKKIQKSGFVD